VNRKWWPWLLLALVVVVTVVVVALGSAPDDSPAARTRRLSAQLACPECTGESVADSNSVSSRAIREKIPALIAEGRSDAEIRAYFVSVYGRGILLTPSNEGLDLVAWVVPVLAVLGGGAGLFVAFRRWSRAPRRHATPEDEEIVARERER